MPFELAALSVQSGLVTATTVRLYRQASLPQRLQALAVLAYLVVFAVSATARHPGLGIGQGFYIPIVLASLGGTLLAGVGAGLAAAVLYELALVIGGSGSGELSWLRSGIHLVTYVGAGAIVGYFAARARGMMSDALHVLEDLLHIARRDLDTGVLNTHGLERALAERIAHGIPFSLLVGEIDCADRGEAGLRRVAKVLLGRLDAGAEVARVGPAQLAVVTTPGSLAGARAAAEALERALDETGSRATFGWTVQPGEGTDTWSLFRAASERLYARRIVRGEWAPTPASAGLVDELIRPTDR